MQKPGEILEQIQRIASDMQNKVGDAIRNSPAQEIECARDDESRFPENGFGYS